MCRKATVKRLYVEADLRSVSFWIPVLWNDWINPNQSKFIKGGWSFLLGTFFLFLLRLLFFFTVAETDKIALFCSCKLGIHITSPLQFVVALHSGRPCLPSLLHSRVSSLQCFENEVVILSFKSFWRQSGRCRLVVLALLPWVEQDWSVTGAPEPVQRHSRVHVLQTFHAPAQMVVM